MTIDKWLWSSYYLLYICSHLTWFPLWSNHITCISSFFFRASLCLLSIATVMERWVNKILKMPFITLINLLHEDLSFCNLLESEVWEQTWSLYHLLLSSGQKYASTSTWIHHRFSQSLHMQTHIWKLGCDIPCFLTYQPTFQMLILYLVWSKNKQRLNILCWQKASIK